MLFINGCAGPGPSPGSRYCRLKIYMTVDSIVASTPHTDFDCDDTGGDVVMTITTRGVEDVENMVDDGLVTYAASLSGRVSVEIELNGGGGRTILAVTQTK